MKIAFKTFGCKANSVDTDYLVAEAGRRGWEIVPEEDVADAYVINSCTVTHAADRDARVIVYPGVGRGFDFRPPDVRTLADDLAAQDSLARAARFIEALIKQ